jgi:hypothetical protein
MRKRDTKIKKKKGKIKKERCVCFFAGVSFFLLYVYKKGVVLSFSKYQKYKTKGNSLYRLYSFCETG